jgi:hypothetical protein
VERPSRVVILWATLLVLSIVAGLPGCGPAPEDTRTVCEWVIMEYQVLEALTGVDRAIERLTDAAYTGTSPRVILREMETALRDLKGEYGKLQSDVVAMRPDFESPVVLDALTEVQEALVSVQDSLDECIEIFEGAQGDVERLYSREWELEAAIDRILQAADAVENVDAASDMLECARRVLRRL